MRHSDRCKLAVAAPILILTSFASRGWSETHAVRKMERWLGGGAVAILRNADRVEPFAVRPWPAGHPDTGFVESPSSHRLPPGTPAKISAYPVYAVGPLQSRDFAQRLSAILLDEHTYSQANIVKGCILRPGVGFRVWAAQEFVDVVVCFQCDQVQVSPLPGRTGYEAVAYGDIDPARARFVALAQESLGHLPEMRAIPASRPTISGRNPPVANDAMVGPAAAVIQPPEQPVQLRGVKLPPGVNRRWLQSDCDLFWRVRRALPPDPARAALAGLSKKHSSVKEVDLGFGLVRHEQRAGGGYFGCYITAVTYAGGLVSMQVSCWGHPPEPAQTRPIIERALGEGFRRVGAEYAASYRTDYELPSANRRARAALDAHLGPLAPVVVPAQLASAYAKLMSAEEELAVGAKCGIVATPPPGADETEVLRSARRIDLLRNVLRGPNPEGRVYALRALRQLGALDAHDRSSVELLMTLPIKVRNCVGCATFADGTIEEALRRLE